MSSISSKTTSSGEDYRLPVSNYDRVSSMLLSMVILLGIFVFILFIIWLTSQIFLRHAAVPVRMVELGESDTPIGGGDELEDIEDWGLESDLITPMLPETLASIADAVGPQKAMLDSPRLTGSDQAGGTGDGRMPAGDGFGTGMGRRWEFRFPRGQSKGRYAKTLDFFGIVLGVVQKGGKVEYAYNLSASTPSTKVGPSKAEKRYYMTWKGGTLRKADEQLLDDAKIKSQGRPILKFLSPELESKLQGLVERKQQIDQRQADTVRRTEFGIREEGTDMFEFYIIEQSYK